MKVIVTGPTGRVGQEVVKKCLENVRITKVVILTRTGLSGEIESHPKADVIMHQDFMQYSDYLIRRMQGAEACIWYVEQNTMEPTYAFTAHYINAFTMFAM